MTELRDAFLRLVGVLVILFGVVGLYKFANSHEVGTVIVPQDVRQYFDVPIGFDRVTVLRGTDETYAIGPSRSNLPAPKAATRRTNKGLARIGRIGRRR